MATTWIDLVGYVRVRYEIFDQSDDTLRFHLPVGPERTQRVAVHHVPDSAVTGGGGTGTAGGAASTGAHSDGTGPGWIVIESAVGRADAVDLGRLLELAGESAVGGVVVSGGVALLRHTASLAELSPSTFDIPFQLVTRRADELEHQLTGADHF